MGGNIVVDVLRPIPYLAKILVLELWAKMLSAIQIAEFFKM